MIKINHALIILISVLLAVSCTNIAGKSSLNTAGSTIVNTSSGTTTFTNTLSGLPSIVATAGSSGSTGTMTITLYQATPTGYQPFTNFCGLGSSNPCSCQMTWTQVDTVNGQAYNYPRTKRIPVTVVQAGLVQCLLDQSIWSQIPIATQIGFSVVPMSGNNTGLSTNTLAYLTGDVNAPSGDFEDSTGTPIRNIARYTCWSKNPSRAYEVLSQFSPANASGSSTSSSSSTTFNIIMGSRYCTGNSSSSGSSGTTSTCPNARSGYSAQSYYRNFYIPNDTLGNIVSTNDTYDCPQVLEGIKTSAGQTTYNSTAPNAYWPLDITFALASGPTSAWSVGVPAAVSPYQAGSINSTQTLCVNEPDTSKRLTDGKVVQQCLGYAQVPASNGTCSSIQTNTGQVVPMTRLRRFRVIYPPVFDATGNVVSGNTFADEVYVPDRLVVDNSGNATGAMIYGPKPCNYSWFDHEGVTKRDGLYNFYSNLQGDTFTVAAAPSPGYATPGYRATSSYQYIEDRDHPADAYNHHRSWSVDPDGLVLPNFDQTGSVSLESNSGYASCSVSLPWVDWNGSIPNDLRLITTHKNRLDYVSMGSRNIYLKEIALQTVDPWIPNYVEDTSFLACVPMPTQFVEAPLHFYKENNNTMSWCAEVYPTQNPYWYDLNKYRKPQNGSSFLTANLVNFPSATATATPAPVQIYTSHDTTSVTSNSGALDALYNTGCSGTLASAVCAMTATAYGSAYQAYCNQYLARNNFTCDRTVVYNENQRYLDFPLLAQDTDINAMLSADLSHNKSFSCLYSVNADPTKVGTAMPSSGCCGYVGSPSKPLLQPLFNATNGSGAHLEPYHDPTATSDVRFCGWPVQ